MLVMYESFNTAYPCRLAPPRRHPRVRAAHLAGSEDPTRLHSTAWRRATLATLVVLAAATLGALSVCAQDFDQITRPVAMLTRSAQIDSFLHALLIPLPDTVSRLEIIDLTGNGYGPDDIVIVYPSFAAYSVGSQVPRTLQDIMKSWELEADYRLDATLAESRTLEADAHQRKDPRGAIGGAVISAVASYYDGQAIDVRLTQQGGGLRLEMWNYDPLAMRYRMQPSGPACLTDRAQQFRFTRPRFVTAFREPGSCIETRHDGDRLLTRPCPTQ